MEGSLLCQCGRSVVSEGEEIKGVIRKIKGQITGPVASVRRLGFILNLMGNH